MLNDHLLNWYTGKYIAKLWHQRLESMAERSFRPLSADEIRTLVLERNFHPWLLYQAITTRPDLFGGILGEVYRTLLKHYPMPRLYQSLDPQAVAGLETYLRDVWESA